MKNTVIVKGVTIVDMVVKINHSVCQSVLLCLTLILLCMDVCICVCTHSILSCRNLRDEMNTDK